MTCPPLIDLSQYVDAELDAVAMARVAQHLGECGPCAESVADFESIASEQDRAQVAAAAGAQCPGSEILLAYLTSASTADLDLDHHVGHCNHCAVTLQQLQRTLALMPEMPAAVPASVRQRVGGAIVAPRPVKAEPTLSLWERLSAALRFPVLVPVSFAAGIMLYVVGQQLALNPGLPAAASRAVPQPGRDVRHVMTPDAIVYADRSVRTEVVAKLVRGDVVDISTQENGWYRVVLADGREG